MIDTSNKYMVGMLSNTLVIMRPPIGAISPDDALVLAAYLVLLAQPMTETQISDVIKAIEST